MPSSAPLTAPGTPASSWPRPASPTVFRTGRITSWSCPACRLSARPADRRPTSGWLVTGAKSMSQVAPMTVASRWTRSIRTTGRSEGRSRRTGGPTCGRGPWWPTVRETPFTPWPRHHRPPARRALLVVQQYFFGTDNVPTGFNDNGTFSLPLPPGGPIGSVHAVAAQQNDGTYLIGAAPETSSAAPDISPTAARRPRPYLTDFMTYPDERDPPYGRRPGRARQAFHQPVDDPARSGLPFGG